MTQSQRVRRESRTAVLNWLIEGYNAYCQNERDLFDNARMRADTDEFASDMDDDFHCSLISASRHHRTWTSRDQLGT